MRIMRCLLSEILGAIIALFAILLTLIASLSVISARMSAAQGEIGWDPISMARNSPSTAAAVIVVVLAIIAVGFCFGYRMQARRVRRRALA